MPAIDSRSVTEETSCLPPLTSQHFEEFTNYSYLQPDSTTRAKEKQNECPETKVTEAVPATPGTDSEITMLKASDASESIKQSESVDLNKESINTAMSSSDQVKMAVRKEGLTTKPPDTEAVNIADDDQPQIESKPIAPLLLSVQHKEYVPQDDTMLVILSEI